MNQSAHTNAPNVGLIDGRGCGQILYTLGARFHAVEFADWCTIAEEIVLRDHILISGKVDKFPRHLRLTLQPYIETGIFRPLKTAYDTVDLPRDERQLRATKLAIEQGLTAATSEDANYEVSRVLGAERFTCIPATPLLRQLQHFGMVRRPQVETMVWDLATEYRNLAEAARGQRQRYQQLANLPEVSIPPIALLAISRCRHFDEVFSELMQIRDDFAPLRAAMRALEEKLTSGRLTPEQALTIETDWRRRWQSLAEKIGKPTNLLALARTSAPLLRDGTKLIAAQEPLGMLDSALACIGHGLNALGCLQLRPVHRPVRNYMRTSDETMRRAIARMFDHDFLRIDADMTALATHPANPWRLAMSTSANPIPRAA